MYTRFITYDLNNGSTEDYQDLYDLIDKYKGVKITESTYKIETSDKWAVFKKNFLDVTKKGDVIFAIVKSDGDIKEWKIR